MSRKKLLDEIEGYLAQIESIIQVEEIETINIKKL